MTAEPIRADRTVWVRTVPTPDGATYMAVLELTDDLSVALPPEHAVRYAMAVLGTVERARHDAAIVGQLTGRLGLPLPLALQTLREIRDGRNELDTGTPLRVSPIVAAADQRPVIVLSIANAPQLGEWQWEAAQAETHALGALQAAVIAPLDAAYFHHLVDVVQIDEPLARAAVGDLAELLGSGA